MLFAHVRASSGTLVQRSNCHPFRHGNWLFMHNGSIAGFRELGHGHGERADGVAEQAQHVRIPSCKRDSLNHR
jgi:predicted glutamine amidotransferase